VVPKILLRDLANKLRDIHLVNWTQHFDDRIFDYYNKQG